MLTLANGGAWPLLLPRWLSWHVVGRWSSLLLVAACLAATQACLLGSPKHAASSAAIGDTCLVGAWTLQQEENESGYTLENVPVAVKGLGGAILTFNSSGEEKETFDGSGPLIGRTGQGELAINISGAFLFQIHADKGKYTETGSRTQLPTTATLNGAPITYQSSYSPGSGTYECSASSLTMVTNDSVQTANWSRT